MTHNHHCALDQEIFEITFSGTISDLAELKSTEGGFKEKPEGYPSRTGVFLGVWLSRSDKSDSAVAKGLEIRVISQTSSGAED